MKVAIHQPHYMPWLSYLRKMMEADVFVYLDNADYTKNGFINRNRIQINGDDHWLTVPVLTKGRTGQAIKDVEVNWDTDWAKKHCYTLRCNYAKEIKSFENRLVDFYLFKPRYKLLMKWCFESINFLRAAFKINTSLVLESALNTDGSGTDRLVSICEAVGADTYLSGPSGRDYLDESRFGNIKVEYTDWKPKSHLSALHFYLKDDLNVLQREG